MKAAPLFLLLALAGCNRAPGPDQVFLQFVAAASAGNHDEAWGLLSEGTRNTADLLAETTRDQVAAAGLPPPENGKMLLFGRGGLELVRDIDRVEVVHKDGKSAQIEVVAEGGETLPVTLARENGAWRIVLPL